jgi:hypothetical protein
MAFPLLIAAGAAVLACGTTAGAAEPSTARDDAAALRGLEHEIARLEREIASEQARMSDGAWLDAQRSAEVQSLIHDVLADADQRASLLPEYCNCGHDKNFHLATADGNFRINLLGMISTRYVLNLQDTDAGDSTRSGFESAKTRFGLTGFIGDPSWQFCLWGGWLQNGRSWLVETWIKKQINEQWSVEAGSFKLPVWQEWIMAEFRQQFVERSLLNARWAAAGTGVRVRYSGEALQLHFSWTDGGRTWNGPWDRGPDATSGALPWQLSSEYSATARVEWLLDGSWAGRGDLNSFPGDEPLYVLGASIHIQEGEYGTIDDENQILQWVVDGTAEFGGASLHAAFISTQFENSTVDRDEWGLLVQGGYFLTDEWEAVARFEYGDLDGAGTISDELALLTVGLTHFWDRHNLKWFVDVGYAFEPIDPAWTPNGAGWRADELGKDGQVTVRTQLQLLW